MSGGEREYGQVAAYCIAMKIVRADGVIEEVTEEDENFLAMLRSSFGLLGIVVEATYRVKRIKPMAVEHVSYNVGEFVERLDELLAKDRSMMLYLMPFLDKVVVEYRFDGSGAMRSNSSASRICSLRTICRWCETLRIG